MLSPALRFGLVAATALLLCGCAPQQVAEPIAGDFHPTERDRFFSRLSLVEDQLVIEGRHAEAIFNLRTILSDLTRPDRRDEGWEDDLRARTLLWLGICLEHVGEPEAAAAEFKQLLQLYPNGRPADHARRLLEGLPAGMR